MNLTSAFEFTYDKRLRRYRYKDSGAFAPLEAVLSLTKRFIEKQRQFLLEETRRLTRKEMRLKEYEETFAQVLRSTHIASAITVAGGVHKLTSKDLDDLTTNLKTQFYQGIDIRTGKRYGLKYLMRDVQLKQMSEAKLLDRVRKFLESSSISYWRILTNKKQSQGKSRAKRILIPGDSCADCIRYAGLGYVSLVDLIMPGEACACGPRCRCHVIYE